MLDYVSIARLKKLNLINAAIANSLGCKWDSVLRIVARLITLAPPDIAA